MTATRLGTWARRNRWGLALLPIAAVAVLAASSDRLDAYYLMANPIRASVAEPGQAITFQTQAVDADGSHDLAVELSLAGTTPTSELWGGDSIDLPDGARLVRVDLALAAPPESILLGCQMAVVDTEGRRYDYQHLPIGGGSQPVSPCVPEDTPDRARRSARSVAAGSRRTRNHGRSGGASARCSSCRRTPRSRPCSCGGTCRTTRSCASADRCPRSSRTWEARWRTPRQRPARRRPAPPQRAPGPGRQRPPGRPRRPAAP